MGRGTCIPFLNSNHERSQGLFRLFDLYDSLIHWDLKKFSIHIRSEIQKNTRVDVPFNPLFLKFIDYKQNQSIFRMNYLLHINTECFFLLSGFISQQLEGEHKNESQDMMGQRQSRQNIVPSFFLPLHFSLIGCSDQIWKNLVNNGKSEHPYLFQNLEKIF